MSENKKKVDKIIEFFKINNIPATITLDEKSERINRCIAFHADPTVKKVDEQFESLMLVDGKTKVTIEPEVKVDSAFVIETPEGAVAAPIGEYELQDGRVIVVMEAGIIAEVKEKVTNEEVVVADEAAMTDQKETTQKVKSLIERTEREQIFEKVAELVKSNDKLKTENSELTKQLNAVNDKFSKFEGLLTELFEEPVVKPTVKTQETFNSQKKNKWADALK